jgi:ribonuclease HII
LTCLEVDIDKQGGRNHYSALLQPAFAPGMVLAREEGFTRSVYQVTGLPVSVRLTLTPRADVGCFAVALASMISKYLRELLMVEFNAFWRAQMPQLKPTAGYPTDARRFWREILPALKRLPLTEDQVWRKR